MTIIGIFKNNIAVFMSQLSKFPQDPSPSKKLIDNATGINTTDSNFYNETTGDTDLDLNSVTGTRYAGLKYTGTGSFNFQELTISMKKTGTPGGSMAMILFNPDGTVITNSQLLNKDSTLTTSYTDITFIFFSGVWALTQNRRLVLQDLSQGDGTNFISVETDALTSTADFAQATSTDDTVPITFVDDATNSPVMTVDSG